MLTAASAPLTYGRDPSHPKFTVARFQRMMETGAFTPDDKVELLENHLVLKTPINPTHDGTADFVKAVLLTSVPRGWLVRIQQAIVLPDSQPEPDFAIVRGTSASYLTRYPEAADTGILIEVAEASLLRDQRDKARIYARAKIAEYWIVNLSDWRLEVYSRPTGPIEAPAYQADQSYTAGESLPLMLDGQTVANIAVADMLP
jgi:Uma2 family endonuclease